MENQSANRFSFSPNSLVTLILIGLAFVVGVWATRCYFQKTETIASENSTVLLEQIKQVCKLVTIEGQFSEVYDYKDYWGYDVSILQKKALIRVKAKVSVGFDLNQVKFESLLTEKKIRISNLPKPQILGIDHTLDYYDITEGVFNSFTAADYNRLNEAAKNFIRSKAEQSSLLSEATKQGMTNLEMIRVFAESAGWSVEIIGNSPPAKN